MIEKFLPGGSVFQDYASFYTHNSFISGSTHDAGEHCLQPRDTMWVSERGGMPGGEWMTESDMVSHLSLIGLKPYAVAPG